MLGYNEQELVMRKALVEFACSQMQTLECIHENAYAHIFCIFELLTVLKWWTIPMFSKTELDMQRIEALGLLHRGR